MSDTPTWPTSVQIEQSARALDPEAWAILDSDSIGMMTRRKVSLEQARKALSAVNPYEWRGIESAPRDGTHVLLFGLPSPNDGCEFTNPIKLTGYWDDIDAAWCATTSTWVGPFIDATKWQPLPPEPEGE